MIPIQNIIEESPFSESCTTTEAFNETTIYFHEPKKIHHLLSFLKECKISFQMLIDICGVHYPQNNKPFEVVYHLLSLTENQRLRIICQLDEAQEIHTVESVYNAACWFERETYDMYGIIFTNSNDLRRILTDYNFQGFPLRKDFPLTGHTEVRYDVTKGEIVYDPVSLSQDYRQFDFSSNWSGNNE
ncbi:MAG: NADH-quinone oxidoreductase subunit C [Candidatus Deianiraeaceae bacterium]|jgi:NADH-quinone oxidoreductase subunit C